MKEIPLSQAWFKECPRYLSVNRFCEAAGLIRRQKRIESLVDQGMLPTRRIGRYLMVDMHELMLMLPCDTERFLVPEEFEPDLTS
jgi:hypothetical protein